MAENPMIVNVKEFTICNQCNTRGECYLNINKIVNDRVIHYYCQKCINNSIVLNFTNCKPRSKKKAEWKETFLGRKQKCH